MPGGGVAHRNRSPARVALALLAGGALTSALAADEPGERPAVVPYRPTVSTPASLSAPGWIEVELGGLAIRPDDGTARRLSVPYTLKLAFTDDWGIRVGGEALVRAGTGGDRETGFGDTSVVVKRRFAVDSASAFGLEAAMTYPTARRVLESGSGKPDASVNAIYSADAGEWHTDVNVIDVRSGSRREGQSRLQTVGAVALSRSVSERWTAAGEVSGTRQRGTASTSQVLAAMSYALRRDVVVDFGAARGLNHATPTWQAFAGVTFLVGRID